MADTRLSIPMVNGATIHLLPGFRFRPSDHELVIKYLYPRAIHLPLPCAIITDVDIHQHNPWDIVPVAERENGKHFFTRKEVKYPGSRRNNRVAGDGFWRVAGSEVPIYYKPEGAADDVLVGMRRTLVFNYGKSRSAERTEWAMSEFRLAGAGLFPRPMMRCATSSGSKPPCGCLEATIAKVGDDGSVEEKTNGKHFFIREENERLGDHHNSRAADDGFWRKSMEVHLLDILMAHLRKPWSNLIVLCGYVASTRRGNELHSSSSFHPLGMQRNLSSPFLQLAIQGKSSSPFLPLTSWGSHLSRKGEMSLPMSSRMTRMVMDMERTN